MSHPPCTFQLNRHATHAAHQALPLATDALAAWQFHQTLPDYTPTPLVTRPDLAASLGLHTLWIKNEAERFGLNAFKGMGASYAMHRYLNEHPGRHTFTTATAGNHGRAVAWAARILNQEAVIYMPASASHARIQAIEGEGATVVRVDGAYEAAIEQAKQAEHEHGWVLLQDTAWDGYTKLPSWIMAGYTTSPRELESSLHPIDAPAVDIVFVQAGVGSWAAAVVWYYHHRYGSRRPKLVCVEPSAANCVLASAQAETFAAATGDLHTVMACLNCAWPSTIAWDILRTGVDVFLGIPDSYAEAAMRALFTAETPAASIQAGASGAAGMAGLLALMQAPELAAARAALNLGSGSRVLTYVTEGANNPQHFAHVVRYFS